MIAGVSEYELGTYPLSGECPVCHTVGGRKIQLLQDFFHLSAIPIFPIGKRGRASCSNCSVELQGALLPAEFFPVVTYLKQQRRTPVLLFAGPIVGVVFTIALVWLSHAKEASGLDLLAHPREGMIISTKLKTDLCLAFRVDDLRPDSVLLRAASRTEHSAEDLAKSLARDGFVAGNDSAMIARSDLKQWDLFGKAIRVDTPNSASAVHE